MLPWFLFTYPNGKFPKELEELIEKEKARIKEEEKQRAEENKKLANSKKIA